MEPQLPFRVGIGFDSHRLVAGGPLRLGGLDIPCSSSLAGHSDADAVLHAVTDALLGALGLGDIGELFPDSDAANLGRDSADFVREALRRVESQNYIVGNCDLIVHAERPKLSPFKQPMRENVAKLLKVAPSQVSVKAKTGEGVGPVGQGQVIEVHCVVGLMRPSDL